MNPTNLRSTRPTLIYTLNVDDVPAYVGLTTREPSVRLFEHLESAQTGRTLKDRVLAAAQATGSTVTITVIETVPAGQYTDQEERHRERLEYEGYALLNSKAGDTLNALTRREQAQLRAQVAAWKRTNKKALDAINRKQAALTKKRHNESLMKQVIDRHRWTSEHGV